MKLALILCCSCWLLCMACTGIETDKMLSHPQANVVSDIAEDSSGANDDSISKYLPDTSVNFKSDKELSMYIFAKSRELHLFLQRSRDSIELSTALRDSIELSTALINRKFDDYQQYLWFKQVKKMGFTQKAISMLSFASPYSTLVTIQERREYFAKFPLELQQSPEGKKTHKRLEEYSNNNVGRLFIKDEVKAIAENGNTVTINPFLKRPGKTTLVIFGASYCGPCILQEKMLAKRVLSSKSSKYEIIALSVDTNPANWFSYVRKEMLPWNSFVLVGGISNALINRLHFEAVPRNFLVDENGFIVEEHTDLERLSVNFN